MTTAAASGGRLDAALAERGLARSRTHAARLIASGLVTVDGQPAVKPSTRVQPEQSVEVAALDHYVSRAAHKLIAALDDFGIDPVGRVALDLGASTGGFTQVLLERGAAQIIALDVGHAQLSASIRSDSRVTVVEGFNARFITPAALEAVAPASEPIDLIVADLSFIALPLVLPAVVATVGLEADYVLLIKPQFEVGRSGVKEGIVRRPELRADAVNGVLWAAFDLGLRTAGVSSSPIAGTNGNHEYLAWLSGSAGSDPSQWSGRVRELTGSR